MIRNLRKLILRAFPELGGYHVTRLGTVEAISDPPDAEKATDRFRPRYAVDVQLLTIEGQPDESRPLLKGLPLPAQGGLYAFPEIGQRVRIAYDYGSPAHPYISHLVGEGQPMPELSPGERLWQHSDGNYLRWDAKGNLTIQTDGELREDSGQRTIAADATTETHGELSTDVLGDHVQTIGGRLVQEILSGMTQQIGSDVRSVILGSLDAVVTGDRNELVGANFELVSGQALSLKSVAGDVLLEAIAGSAELKAAVKSSVVSALVDIGLSPTEAMVLGTAFMTLFNMHTHPVSGAVAGATTFPMIPGTHTSATTKTK